MPEKIKVRILKKIDEKKKDCFKNKTFNGKVKCIIKQKNLSKEKSSAYVASVLRKKGELDEEMELEERCQKGYKTHPKRKTKVMFGKTYRNCVKAD